VSAGTRHAYTMPAGVPRWRLTAPEILRPPCASRNSSTSIHWGEHLSSAVSRRRLSVSVQLTGQRAGSDYPRGCMEGNSTRAQVPARSPLAAVTNDNASELILSRIVRLASRSGSPKWSWQGIAADASPAMHTSGWYHLAPNRVLNRSPDGDRWFVQGCDRTAEFAVAPMAPILVQQP